MERTTIMLPHALKSKAHQTADRKHISFGELVRQSLEEKISESMQKGEEDVFFSDQVFYDGEIPTNLSTNGDDFLYEGTSI